MFSVDQEDLYVYQTGPDAPLDYRYQDRWEPMRVVRELIPVRDGPPAEVELAFTRHGPVIRADAERHTAFAVRAAWLEPGMAPYLGSIDYMRATSWEQFTAAHEPLGRAGREPGLRRHRRQHRLEGGRADADPAELGRHAAGAGRRAL